MKYVMLISLICLFARCAVTAKGEDIPSYFYDSDLKMTFSQIGSDESELIIIRHPEEWMVDQPQVTTVYHGNVVLPSSIQGKNITGVAPFAFYHCKGDILELSPTIGFIDEFAFMNADFDIVKFGENLRFISNYCFQGCTELHEIQFNRRLYSIGDVCFCNLGVKNLEFGKQLCKIGNNCFNSNPELLNVIIPSGLYSLGEGCFNNCEKLERIEFNANNLETIDNCFNGCKGIKEIVLNVVNVPYCNNSFDQVDFENCILTVSPQLESRIGDIPFWKNFSTIRTYSSDVDATTFKLEDMECADELISITGIRLSDENLNATQLNALPKGLYIINGKKILK